MNENNKWIRRGLHFQDFNISKKFIVSLFLLLIIPLTGLFLWINQNVTSQMDIQNSKTNLEILKQTKTPIDYMIQDVSYISLEVLGNANLQKYLTENLGSDEKEKLSTDIKYELGKLINSRDNISRVSIFNEEKILFQFGGFIAEESMGDLEEVKQLKGKPMWLPARLDERYVSKKDRIYEVSMARAINDFKTLNRIVAFEKINISEGYLCSLYGGIKSEGTESLFIIDKKGEVISSVNKELLETNISSKSYFSQLLGNTEGYFSDNEKLISYYEIPNAEWYMVKVDKKNSVFEGGILNSIIAICIILTLIFGICFYFIQKRQIITPVTQLCEEVKKFHEGQYEIRLHTSSHDEIGELNQCFVDMGAYIQNLIERVYKIQIKEKESQLQYLQSQINPHFLYNTLDAIRWMAIKEKQTDIAIQIEALSNLFKHALNQGKDMTTVEKEVKHLEDYITIQKNRFGDSLHVNIQVDEDVKELPVLNLILQPLVENSITHGLEQKLGEGMVNITIHRDSNYLYYNVEDNGLGTDEETIRNKLVGSSDCRNALALNNVNKRIKYKYGDGYGIQFYSEIGVGTKVEIKIPIEMR